MKIFPLIILRLSSCLASSTNRNKNALRIVGGRNATEDEFPFAVRLMVQSLVSREKEYRHLCTGAALNSKWTLTAAHCIDEEIISMPDRAVIAYHPSPKSEFAYSEVVSAVVHPVFSSVKYRNDMGLVHTQPMQLTKYAKLSSIDYSSLNGQEVSILGYGGYINNDPGALPNILQVLDVVVKQCSKADLYPQMCFARACSPNIPVKSLCPGDSGGPVVHASGIVAVNSLAVVLNCGIYEGPAFRRRRHDVGYEVGSATPVSPYVDWLSNHINQKTFSL